MEEKLAYLPYFAEKEVHFTVPGKPQGKARAKVYRNPRTGFTTAVTPENTVLYENFIKECYLKAADGVFFAQDEPVKLIVLAKFAPPASTPKKQKAAMLAGQELPLKKPDADNIMKVVADALNGVAYHDDRQVVRITLEKTYAEQEALQVSVSGYRPMELPTGRKK